MIDLENTVQDGVLEGSSYCVCDPRNEIGDEKHSSPTVYSKG